MFRVRASWNESAHNLKMWRLANRGLRRETPPPEATMMSGTFPKSGGISIPYFKCKFSLAINLKLLSRVESCKRKLIKVLFHSEQIAFQTKTWFHNSKSCTARRGLSSTGARQVHSPALRASAQSCGVQKRSKRTRR